MREEGDCKLGTHHFPSVLIPQAWLAGRSNSVIGLGLRRKIQVQICLDSSNTNLVMGCHVPSTGLRVADVAGGRVPEKHSQGDETQSIKRTRCARTRDYI